MIKFYYKTSVVFATRGRNMPSKYNAFISYKHSDLDNRVASEIQRQLERFKIPKSIKESTKTNKINRIFRDKEELTLTSDLSATIENALSNSDHLIVICSNGSYTLTSSIAVDTSLSLRLH